MYQTLLPINLSILHIIFLTTHYRFLYTCVTNFIDNKYIYAFTEYFSIYKEAGNFHSLEINQTKSEHSGTYSAVATNSSGTVSCKCNLIVDKGIRTYIGPKFVDKLEKVYSITEGSELRIRAVICAYPAVGITWFVSAFHVSIVLILSTSTNLTSNSYFQAKKWCSSETQ